MLTPQNRFTVLQVQLMLLLGYLAQPALRVVKVAARGLGFEYEQGWRRKTSGINVRALSTMAAALLVGLIFPALLFGAPLIMGMALTEGRHAGEFLLGDRADGGSRDNITVLSGQNLKAGAVVGRVSKGIGRVSIPTVVGTGTGTATLVFAGPDVEVGTYRLQCTAAVAHGGVFSLTTPSSKTLPAFTMTPGSGGTTAYTSRHINFSITDSTDFIVGDYFDFVVSTTVPTVIGGTGTGVLSALSLGPDAKTGRYQIVNNVVVSGGGDMSVIGPDGNNVGGRFVWAASGSTASFTSRQINFTISDATDYIAGNFFDIAVFNQLSGGKVVAWDPTTFDGRNDVAGVLYDNVDASSADLAGAIISRDAAVIKSSLEWGAAITSAQKESAYLELAKLGIVAR